MPSYAPLPGVDLDPRNAAELVEAAARRVYEASGATINDFSSGSPITALLEGQVFAQGELLQYANEFPEAVLLEWIGPFLGAQRRTGSGAVVQLTFEVEPRDQSYAIFAGYQVATNPNLTGGESIGFVTTEDLRISPGGDSGKVNAIAVNRGTRGNVGANTITQSVTSLQGVVGVTNLEAATGGMDPELLSEVKERFFSLIRRRNPTSAEDWTGFFSDALGVGTSVTVLPRRSERDTYLYEANYVSTNPSVAFFVLNPDGTPITKAQQDALNALIKWSLPTEFLGYVYPMEVDQVDFVVDLAYDPTKPYAQNLETFSRQVRNNLYGVMTPNLVFPTEYDQQVSDVTSALTQTFPLTLGVENQFVEPDITQMLAYFSPEQLGFAEFTETTPVTYSVGATVQAGDLLSDQGNAATPTFYRALQPFNPIIATESYYVNTGDLNVTIIRPLIAGTYQAGQVIVDVTPAGLGNLYVVLVDFTYNEALSFAELATLGYIAEKAPSTFGEGGKLRAYTDDGVYSPEIILYTNDSTPFNVGWPTTPVSLAENLRPGAPIYVVANDFQVAFNTTELGQAQNQGLVAKIATPVLPLVPGNTYTDGQYVVTPNPDLVVVGTVAFEDCYSTAETGALQLYAEALVDFDFVVRDGQTYTQAVNDYIRQGFIKPVQIVPYVDCKGEATLGQKPFRYEARFFAGEYVRYRPEGGFDAGELEGCTKLADSCNELTEPCKKLLKAQLPLPSYFFVLKDFTPNTKDTDLLQLQGFMVEVPRATFETTYQVFIPSNITVTSALITEQIIQNYPAVSDPDDLTIGETVIVYGDTTQTERGKYEWTSTWGQISPGLPKFRDIFRFAPGDVASFRSVSDIRNFKATEHVSPVLNLEVYFDNGVFERTNLSQTVPYVDPTYHFEDFIIDDPQDSVSFYRVIQPFTPPALIVAFNGVELPAIPRVEEIFGNLLRMVKLAVGPQEITARLRDHASTVGLGRCQLNLTSSSTGSATNTFVYEATATAQNDAVLSFYTGGPFLNRPVNYGLGTLAL